MQEVYWSDCMACYCFGNSCTKSLVNIYQSNIAPNLMTIRRKENPIVKGLSVWLIKLGDINSGQALCLILCTDDFKLLFMKPMSWNEVKNGNSLESITNTLSCPRRNFKILIALKKGWKS